MQHAEEQEVELSNEQREIVEAPLDENTVVMSCAASGKTNTLTERLRYVLRHGVNPNRIVALTFTNNAAAEMRARLGDDFKTGMFMGTVHSYANMLLGSCGIDTSYIRDEEEFDELFELIEENPQVLRPVDYLLCDEAQDLNPNQFNFITELVQPRAILIVGDCRQAIYTFSGANPDLLMNLTRNPEYKVRNLTRNYRNARNILNFSNSIIRKIRRVPQEPTEPMRKEMGTIELISQWEMTSVIKREGPYKKWAILCRTNAKVDNILHILERNKIPAITFRQAEGDLTELQNKMEMNAVKVLTIHSAKGLEFDNVIVCDLFTHGQENMRLNYVSVTRARNKLYICQ